MSRTEEVNKMTENVYKVRCHHHAIDVIHGEWFSNVAAYKCDCRGFMCLQGILDQFNPSLKNFVTMGKHYEKALMGEPHSSSPDLYSLCTKITKLCIDKWA